MWLSVKVLPGVHVGGRLSTGLPRGGCLISAAVAGFLYAAYQIVVVSIHHPVFALLITAIIAIPAGWLMLCKRMVAVYFRRKGKG